MKTNPLALLTMGRSLIRLKDRTGAYKLPTGKAFPEFGSSGRRRAVLPAAVRAPVSANQPGLFEAVQAPAAAPVGASAPIVALAQTAPLPSAPPKASPASSASSASFSSFSSCLSHASAIAARLWTRIPQMPSLSAFKLRIPRVLQFNSNSVANDSRPRAQAELALEKVTVLRNDLSDADLVVMKLERKKENAQASIAGGSPASGNAWTRATARWIKLKSQPAPGDSKAMPERPAQVAELHP